MSGAYGRDDVMSGEYGRAHVAAVRRIGNLSLRDAVNALEVCRGDPLLAVGYAQYEGLAVKIGSGSAEERHAWQMKRAEQFKANYLSQYGEIELDEYLLPIGPSL